MQIQIVSLSIFFLTFSSGSKQQEFLTFFLMYSALCYSLLHLMLLLQEEPAVIESYYNKRIVGCPGGEGEDEHDVVWFWLKKDEPHECPVCSQYFVLKVIGDGGDPDGHDDDDEGHH